jgi:succinate dehydrogenase / fumarate reductase flavoprotein subunit
MQGLADGYFILPATVPGYLAGAVLPPVTEEMPAVREVIVEVRARLARLLAPRGRRTAEDFHRALGRLLGDACGLAREGRALERALRDIPALRAELWEDLRIPGSGAELNQELEQAGRVADYLELGELMCRDALAREESCGCHLRVEHQTPDGEPRRDDRRFAHVALWTHRRGQPPLRSEEPLVFESMRPADRSYR